MTLTAIAADTAGNAAISSGLGIIVDLIAPTADSAVATNAEGTSIAVTVSEPVTLTNLATLDGGEFRLDGGTSALVTAVAVSAAGDHADVNRLPGNTAGRRSDACLDRRYRRHHCGCGRNSHERFRQPDRPDRHDT